MLLLRVTQANGRPLPTGGFMSRAMTQMIHDIMGVLPKEADYKRVGDSERKAKRIGASKNNNN